MSMFYMVLCSQDLLRTSILIRIVQIDESSLIVQQNIQDQVMACI